MLVISDSTPIISLAKISQLDLLQKLFKKAFIPRAVWNELTSNEFYADEIVQIKSANFIIVHDVCDKNSVKILNEIVGLDIGESEAISLAICSSADVLLIDEHKGRQVASQLNLNIVGTVGFLLQAFDENFLSRQDILLCIDILRDSSVRISEKLFNLMLNHINQSL